MVGRYVGRAPCGTVMTYLVIAPFAARLLSESFRFSILTVEISVYLKFNRKRWLANRRAQLRTNPPSPVPLPLPDDEPAVNDSSVCFSAALTLVSEIVGKKVAIE